MPAPLQVGTPQGVALALFIKQWLVPRQSEWLAGFLFLRITLVNFFMELLIIVPVIAGAGLLGSFLGKAFVAIIQKFSND